MEGGVTENMNTSLSISSNCVYRDCLRNHAASLGSYATDGCGEFTPDDMSPGSLQCAACGCHRNFHRKVTYPPTHHHGHSYGRIISGRRDRDSDHSGDQTTAEAEAEAELMVVDDHYAAGGSEPNMNMNMMLEVAEEMRSTGNKKRFRTKFTAEQKEKMLGFAEKLGWKLQRKDLDDEIERFCRGVGVSRQVFKVWMHNHKNSSSNNSPSSASASASTGNASSLTQ